MPTTLGAILLFLATFAAAILWATDGKTDAADHQGETPGKTS